MTGRSHSISDHAAFHLALFAFACVLMFLLGGSTPTRLSGTDWLTRHIDKRVERTAGPNHTGVPMVPLDIRSADGLHEEVAELSEPTEEDETDHYLLEALRFDIAPFRSQTGLYESSADRALTPFLLRVFSSRGSPSA